MKNAGCLLSISCFQTLRNELDIAAWLIFYFFEKYKRRPKRQHCRYLYLVTTRTLISIRFRRCVRFDRGLDNFQCYVLVIFMKDWFVVLRFKEEVVPLGQV